MTTPNRHQPAGRNRVAAARTVSMLIALALTISPALADNAQAESAKRSSSYGAEQAESPGMSAYRAGDYSSAFKHFKRVARSGCVIAQYNLGIMYSTGQGVRKNYRKAAYWYGRSATRGKAAAQYNLANLYDNGLGVKRNSQKAANWYRRAARNGNVNAQFNLSQMYQFGEGVSRSSAKSYYWIARAARQDPARYAAYRKAAWQKLTPSQRAGFQKQAGR